MTLFDQVRDYDSLKKQWFEQWFNKSNSFNSLDGAEKALKSFEGFVQFKFPNIERIKLIDELLKAYNTPDKFTQVYIFLNEYIQYLVNKKTNPKTIRIYFMFVRSFLRQWGIRIYNEDVKQFCHFPKQIKELRQPLTKEKIKKLYDASSNKWKAIILIAISSGARIGEIIQSISSDYIPKPYKGRTIIEFRLRAITTKTREERSSFISQQAWEHARPYLKGPNDLVFIEEWDKDTIVKIESTFNKIRERCGLTEKYSNGFNYHVNIHSFRSFFITKATQKVGENIAHAWAGHHKYLDQYFRLTPEERAEEYLKVEPEFLISEKS